MTSKAQISLALGLSAVALLLRFALGAIFLDSQPLFNSPNLLGTLAFLTCLGGFTMGAQFVLSRGHRQAIQSDWPVCVTLNCALLFVSAISLVVEPNHLVALEAVAVAVFALLCSFAGAGVAQRLAPAH